MKKLFIFSSLILSLLGLASCNKKIGLGNYTFNKIHLVHSNKCVEISSWYESETGIEVHLPDGSVL